MFFLKDFPFEHHQQISKPPTNFQHFPTPGAGETAGAAPLERPGDLAQGGPEARAAPG